MRWILIVGMLAGCAGLAQEPGPGDGGQCSCPAGPPGPQGPKGDPGEPGTSGGGGAGADASKSGSRLRYLGKTLRGSDGSVYVQQGNFFDEELGVECSPGVAADGKPRCFPSGPSVVTVFTPTFFEDDDCKRPAITIESSGGCSPLVPKFAFFYTTGACEAGWDRYYIGSELSKAYIRSWEGCEEANLQELRAFRIGQEVRDSSLASFE